MTEGLYCKQQEKLLIALDSNGGVRRTAKNKYKHLKQDCLGFLM